MEESALRSHLGRLVLSVEAQVVNGSTSGRSSPPASDTIFTGTVQDVSDPFILVDEEGSDSEDETTQYVYAAWKLPVFLSRPRIRLQSPSVVFAASAVLRPEVQAELASSSHGYLPSGVASGFNLLAAFGSDPALNGVKPQLSALRVSKVSPLTRQQDLAQHIRALQQLRIPVYPALHTRVRFSRPNTAPISQAVIAILEVDFTPYFECEVMLDKIHLTCPNTDIQPLSSDASMDLPIMCVAHDHLTFLYHLNPLGADATGPANVRDLAISISATANVAPGVCTPVMTMEWAANVDFSTPVNPNFGPSFGRGSIQRSHRPSQLSIGSGSGNQAVMPLKPPSITRPDALPTLEASTTHSEAPLADLGITMSFTGPSAPVRLGEVFSWAVHVVNRSTEAAGRPARKFAIVAVPRRRRNETRAMRPPSSNSRRRGASMSGWDLGRSGASEVANAVLDENVLHAMQKSSIVQPADLVCLSPETRVGPLAPGTCHDVELQFLALKEGLVSVEAIRVVDLGSQDHVDIRDLPAVMVEPAAA